MTKIFAESDITIDTLEAHIRDSGLVPHKVEPDGIWIRSPQGLGFRISIIEERKFVSSGPSCHFGATPFLKTSGNWRGCSMRACSCRHLPSTKTGTSPSPTQCLTRQVWWQET